jgi:2-octaprenyl-3-methyl-6-methoxy-1,4-benzoquinol hydroxylase
VLVAADGAQSQLKQLAGIGSLGWQYQQACLLVHVCTDYGALPMTWQQFTPQGPRAYLPLPGQQASLVWYDDHLRIQQLATLAPAQLAQQIRQHFPAELGDFTVLKQAYFPLTRSHANHYVKGRLVLVGDAAHTINPLAGQGVNLGFADAQCLADLLIKQFAGGTDLAAASLLAQYERERRKANLLMMSAMDVFYQVFSSQLAPLVQIRRLGLQLAGKTGPLKTYVGRYAAGLV